MRNDCETKVYENHAQDSRIRELDGCSPAIPAKAGTGGGNLPLVLVPFGLTTDGTRQHTRNLPDAPRRRERGRGE